jgi:Uma2 family endonuclease
MALAIQLSPHQEQIDFNLTCWEKILADPDLAALNQRIETNRHGNIIMSPPPGNPHSFKQSDLHFLLRTKRPDGRAQVEVPISTSDGIRAADVAWTSEERFPEIYDPRAYLAAPNICIEVVSPANSAREMAEKKALYFDAGASEVWLCQVDGSLEFFATANPEKKLPQSALFPDFPIHIESP